MEKIGIICEYNPFHNGHLYHLKKIKNLYPDSLIILILNGYFTQRGEISILSKQAKCQIALENGIDIVIELPFIYGTQSSDTFAFKSIEILNYFQIDRIIFGSETNNLNFLKSIAQKQLDNPPFDSQVKNNLNCGLNYPTALSKALNISNKLNPNDLLGISYLKAILKINPSIKVQTIKRTNSYHDLESNDNIISASNIRNKLKNNQDINGFVPNNIISDLNPINEELLFTLLKYQITTNHNLETYLTVDEGIENRLTKNINKVKNLSELQSIVKTKRYTYNKINRMFIHLLIGLKKSDAKINLEYINVLGFNQKGKKYLNKIKKDILIPLSPIPKSITFTYELTAALIYDLLTNSHNYQNELKRKPILYDEEKKN